MPPPGARVACHRPLPALIAVVCWLAFLLPACTLPPATFTPTVTIEAVARGSAIPQDAVKVLPETDPHPPVLHVGDYAQPMPVPGLVNTAGAEDSPFVTPDGNTLYFFFTPDVQVAAERQILDGVTGIYESHRVDGEWIEPERVALQEPGKLAADGCAFVLNDTMWFCTAREGYTGLHWFTARRAAGEWTDWEIADFDPAYQVGELHITANGSQLYFASDRPGGHGGLDIWASEWVDGRWGEPANVAAANTADGEGWPALSPDGNELWFGRNFGIWRSTRTDGKWGAPELIVSSLAGEPSLDAAGNLYFVHHFFEGDTMIEADIYVAYKQ